MLNAPKIVNNEKSTKTIQKLPKFKGIYLKFCQKCSDTLFQRRENSENHGKERTEIVNKILKLQ